MTTKAQPKYKVSEFRNAGLDARWTRTSSGAPIIACREGAKPWYVVDDSMFKSMQRDGVLEGFRNHTLLGDFFSIPA